MPDSPTPPASSAGLLELGTLARKLAEMSEGLAIVIHGESAPQHFDLEASEVSAAASAKGGILIVDSLPAADPKAALQEIAQQQQPDALLLCLPEKDLIAREPQPQLDDRSAYTFAQARALAGGLSDYEIAHASLTLTSLAHFERHASLFVLQRKQGALPPLGDLLATGTQNLQFASPHETTEEGVIDPPPRVAIITEEINGLSRCGGIGTAYTSLAEHLASAGQEVTILYIGHLEAGEQPEPIIALYQKKGITLEILDIKPLEGILPWEQEYLRRSYLAYHWLAEADRDAKRRVDIIHYPDCNGFGFYCAKAKEAGIAFANTSLCVGTHGSTRWANDANHIEFFSSHQLIQDHMEKVSLRLADTLIGPSQYLIHWMRNRHWQLPAQVFQQPYIQPHAARGNDAGEDPLAAPAKAVVKGLREIVFFGRLETRKGLRSFCDALDHLAQSKGVPEHTTITFLGKNSLVDGTPAEEYIHNRGEAGNWPWPMNCLTDLGQEQAVDYLRGSGRLAVVPSLVDNSPNTVYECIGLGIPFITGGNTGITELLHPEDVAHCTFYHRNEERRGKPLAAALEIAICDGLRPPRPAICQQRNEVIHTDWHLAETLRVRGLPELAPGSSGDLSVCLIYQGEPQARLEACLAAIPCGRVGELIVVCSAERQNALASAPSEARILEGSGNFSDLANLALSEARHERVVLLRPTHVLKANALPLLAAPATDLVIGMTTFAETADPFPSANEQAVFPIGSAPLLHLAMSVPTDVPMVITKAAANKMGGIPDAAADRLNAGFFVAAKLQYALSVGIVPELICSAHDTRPQPGSTAEFYASRDLKRAFSGSFNGSASEIFPGYLRALEGELQKTTAKFWDEHGRANEAESQRSHSAEQSADKLASSKRKLDTEKERAKKAQKGLKASQREIAHLTTRLNRGLISRLKTSLKKRLGR